MSAPQSEDVLVTADVFDAELRALGERMAADGKPFIRQMFIEVDQNGRDKCRFDNWPERLKDEAYQKLGLEPVLMYRRVRK